MSNDTTTTPGEAAAPKPGPPAAEQKAPVEAPAQEPIDWVAEARKWEERAKANKTAADELAALKEAQRVAEQSAADRAAELEAKVKEYETREQIAAWKAEVAAAANVPEAVLRGSTKEELEAHAEALKSLIPAPDVKRGALGPYVPPEGSAPSGSLGGPAQEFADFMNSQLPAR